MVFIKESGPQPEETPNLHSRPGCTRVRHLEECNYGTDQLTLCIPTIRGACRLLFYLLPDEMSRSGRALRTWNSPNAVSLVHCWQLLFLYTECTPDP